MNFLVINGVNLNLTGYREKDVYGTQTLSEINEKISAFCAKNGDRADFYQSNIEGEICDKIHEAFFSKKYAAIILNAGAYTHYSYAIRDAVAGVDVPVVEVHMSNVAAREEFRKTSLLSEVCQGTVFGFGAAGYLAAITGVKEGILDREAKQ